MMVLAMAFSFAPLSLQSTLSLSLSQSTSHAFSFPLSSTSCAATHPALPQSLAFPFCFSVRSYAPASRNLVKHCQLPKSRPPSHHANLSVRCESGEGSGKEEKVPFGYTRKDVILIGVGLTVFGVGLKYGLEFFGLDSLRAGNVVQLVMVLGLTIGWISTYVFRVSTKEMTYAKQLEDYEKKVMQKRLEELPEAELEVLLAQVEEEKRRLRQRQEKP